MLAEQEAGDFDAVFIAIGAHLSKHVDIPARDAVKVLDAVSLLRDVETGEAPLLGRRVVVYGGGNTAMDAARTARRLGADEAMIVYRRDRAHMPAHDFEADEALAEGVKIKWLTSIKAIDGGDLTVERMEIDEEGRPQPTGRVRDAAGRRRRAGSRPGDRQRLPAQDPGDRPSGRRHGGGRPGHDDRPAGHLRRRRHGAGERTVTVAIGHGKKAARHIDAWLRGTAYSPPPKHPVDRLRQAEPADLHRRDPLGRDASCRSRRAAPASTRWSPA